MTRPQYRPNSAPPSPARRGGVRRATRMTVGVSLLIAGATGVTVGAAAYSRNAAAGSSAIIPAAAANPAAVAPLSSGADLRDEADRGRAVTPAIGREVIPGLNVAVGKLRVNTDPTGLRATTLPLNVTNTGDLTRSFDITVVALSDKGQVITSDVGTAANLRPGQSAEVQVLEIVDNTLADQLSEATFRVEEAFAY